MSIDYTTPVGQVRLLIPDTALLENPRDLSAPKSYWYTDEQIEGFLALSEGNVKLAAAHAIEVGGTDLAMQMLVIATDDKKTDGAKMLNSFLGRAASLRREAEREREAELTFTVVDRDWGGYGFGF